MPFVWGGEARLVGVETDRYSKGDAPDPKRSMSADELARLTVGKTPVQIIEAVRPPVRAFDDLEGNPRRWMYVSLGEVPAAHKTMWV
jgi:hypothetical protein